MEMLIYLILSVLLAVAPLFVRTERATNVMAALFCVVQVVALSLLFIYGRVDSVMLGIFRADTLAVLFHLLLTLVLIFTLIHSSQYLRQ